MQSYYMCWLHLEQNWLEQILYQYFDHWDSFSDCCFLVGRRLHHLLLVHPLLQKMTKERILLHASHPNHKLPENVSFDFNISTFIWLYQIFYYKRYLITIYSKKCLTCKISNVAIRCCSCFCAAALKTPIQPGWSHWKNIILYKNIFYLIIKPEIRMNICYFLIRWHCLAFGLHLLSALYITVNEYTFDDFCKLLNTCSTFLFRINDSTNCA